jgi:hypothetical protein
VKAEKTTPEGCLPKTCDRLHGADHGVLWSRNKRRAERPTQFVEESFRVGWVGGGELPYYCYSTGFPCIGQAEQYAQVVLSGHAKLGDLGSVDIIRETKLVAWERIGARKLKAPPHKRGK